MTSKKIASVSKNLLFIFPSYCPLVLLWSSVAKTRLIAKQRLHGSEHGEGDANPAVAEFETEPGL
jgi:hypothetical protein